MPFWLAVVLFILAVVGMVLFCKYLQKDKTMRIFCIILCALLAFICGVYIGLTILFVEAVQNQLPV